MPPGNTPEAEVRRLHNLLNVSMRANKKMRFKMQRALSVINGIVDIIFESTNCYDCMVFNNTGKHKKNCRANEAILFLNEHAKDSSNEILDAK